MINSSVGEALLSLLLEISLTQSCKSLYTIFLIAASSLLIFNRNPICLINCICDRFKITGVYT